MRKKTKKRIIIISIVLTLFITLLFSFGILQQQFQPSPEKLTQYYSKEIGDGEFVGKLLGVNIGTGTRGAIWSSLWEGQSPWSSSNSNVVIINSGKNEFRFNINLNWEQMPLEDGQDVGYGCVQTITVYKNNLKIDEFKKYNRDLGDISEKTYYDDENQDSWVKINLVDQSNSPISSQCSYVINEYSLKLSPDSFNFNIYTSTSAFIEGQEITVYAEIENTLTETYMTDVNLKFEAPTLFGLADKTITKENVLLPPGKTTIELQLTPQTSVGRIDITPSLILKASGTSLVGLNYGSPPDDFLVLTSNNPPYQCSGNNHITSCQWKPNVKNKIFSDEFIPIGSIVGEKTIISVSPNPLYLELGEGESCPNGYILSQDGIYCIRDDIRDLGCVILGCPSIPGHEYICSSAAGGVCVETVFVNKKCLIDSDCPSDTLCDTESGLCVKSEIYKELVEKKCLLDDDCPPTYPKCDIDSGYCVNDKGEKIILQCKQNIDCITPCEGITPMCNEFGKCTYIGECKNIEFGCRDVGCPIGYECNESNNICLEKSKFKVNILGVILIGIVVILIFLIFYLVIKKKKRK